MYKVEGGATVHRGFFGKVLRTIDLLNFMPDPVDWYFDPSQFPEKVELGSAMRPGENIYDKDARAGDHDINFGRSNISRSVVYQTEDLNNATKRILSYFQGGINDAYIEERRGREGNFRTSRVHERSGIEALERALRDGRIGADPRSYIADPSDPVRLSGRPGHIEVDRVERRVTVRPGASQYGRMAEALKTVPEAIEADRQRAGEQAPDLARRAEQARQAYESARGELDAARRSEREVFDQSERMADRIGRERAINEELRRVRERLERAREALRRERARLDELEDELRRRRDGGSDDGREPGIPDGRAPWWSWLGMSLGLAALAAAVWEWLRRRFPRIRHS